MKFFAQKDLKQAYLHAEAGGQSLHLCRSAQFVTSDAPACFKRSKQFAHLIDHDVDRLIATARRLGVRAIKVERGGRSGQHIDICLRPLEKALSECHQPEFNL